MLYPSGHRQVVTAAKADFGRRVQVHMSEMSGRMLSATVYIRHLLLGGPHTVAAPCLLHGEPCLLHVQIHACSTPVLHLLDTCSTPALYLLQADPHPLHACSTPAPYRSIPARHLLDTCSRQNHTCSSPAPLCLFSLDFLNYEHQIPWLEVNF